MIKELLLASALTGGVAMTNLTAPVQEQPQTAAATEQIELVGEWNIKESYTANYELTSGDYTFNFSINDVDYTKIGVNVMNDYIVEAVGTNRLLMQQEQNFSKDIKKLVVKDLGTLSEQQKTLLNTYLSNYFTFKAPPKPLTPADIFKPITTTATAAMSLVSGLLVSVVDIVWTGKQLTPIGLIVLIPVGIGVVFFAINFILKLINKIKIGKKG